MRDQAERLRSMARIIKEEIRQQSAQPPSRLARVVSITSGKGGVGKTNLAVNLAVALQQLGKRVLLLDTDIGLANADLLLGLTPRYNLGHVVGGARSIQQVIYDGPCGLRLIAAGSGFREVVSLSRLQLDRFLDGLEELERTVDLILLDTGAGISHTVLDFIGASHEVILVANPEPTSIADAYALVKVLANQGSRLPLGLVVNKAQNEAEGLHAARRLLAAASRFLQVDITYLGQVLEDPNVPRAVKEQEPFVLAYPESPASRSVQALARAVFLGDEVAAPASGVKAFFQQLARGLGPRSV
ncbi:MAG: MinD/ParA family protein [Bacillota bacterium]